ALARRLPQLGGAVRQENRQIALAHVSGSARGLGRQRLHPRQGQGDSCASQDGSSGEQSVHLSVPHGAAWPLPVRKLCPSTTASLSRCSVGAFLPSFQTAWMALRAPRSLSASKRPRL